MDVELSAADRDAAIAVLARRLTSAELRSAIQKEERGAAHRKGVEWIIAEVERSGADRRLTTRLPDADLAPFLVDLKGSDLLSSRELRKQLAEAADHFQLEALHTFPSSLMGRGGPQSQARAIAQRSWHPGKRWAKHFVKALGLPPALAGIAGSKTEPESLEAEPFRPLPLLEDFQVALCDQVHAVLGAARGHNRGILTLPTGAGKTRTAVEALTEWIPANPGRGVLWIAQSEELCEQAVQAFREVWVDRGARSEPPKEPLLIARLWGAGRGVIDDADVTVASIQKLHSIQHQSDDDARREDLGDLADRIGVVVVDEAHRSLAPSYAEVLRVFDIDLGSSSPSAMPLLGLTATPYRAVDDETRRLARRFHGRLLIAPILGDDPVEELRRRRVLSRPVHWVIKHEGRAISLDDDPRYEEHFKNFADFHPDILRRLGEDVTRNRRLIDVLLGLETDWPTLFFGCSVEHAKAVALLLSRAGRKAGVVTATTRAATRRHLIEQFRDGELSVLSNYGVLTTGFDAPRVRAVVIARPTASPVLYEQMIGRGMRGSRFGGTDECLVFDVEDNIHFDGQMAYAKYSSYWSKNEEEITVRA